MRFDFLPSTISENFGFAKKADSAERTGFIEENQNGKKDNLGNKRKGAVHRPNRPVLLGR